MSRKGNNDVDAVSHHTDLADIHQVRQRLRQLDRLWIDPEEVMKRAIHALHDYAGWAGVTARVEGDDLDDSVVTECEMGARFSPARHTHAQ